MALCLIIVGITHWHAPRYVQMLRRRGITIVGCSDVNVLDGQKKAAEHGIPFFASTAEMLEQTTADLALLLPRHDVAVAEISLVADRKISMLLEKPMGRNLPEAQRSAQMVNAAGVFASVCLPNRHLRIWDVYQELEKEGALGTVIHAHFRMINGPPSRYVQYGVPWMLDPEISGGGVLRNLGVHCADAISTLAGGRTLTLQGGCVESKAHQEAVDDFATGIFTTQDGFVASLEVGYTYANQQEGGDYEWRIAATGAYLHECNGKLRVHRRGSVLEETEVSTPHLTYETMLNLAIDAYEAGAQPPTTVDDCVRAVALQDMLYATLKDHAGRYD